MILIGLFSEMLRIFKKIKIPKENKESDEVFENISFVEMESSKLNIFFGQTCVEMAKALWYAILRQKLRLVGLH